MITYDSFLSAFPEFAIIGQDPLDMGQFEFWSGIAYQQLNANRFGSQLDYAAMLFVAHNITLSLQQQRVGQNALVPGAASGPVSSKSVGPASASYEVGSVAFENAGDWNYTTYGQRLYRLIKQYNSGPTYVPFRAHRFVPWIFR